MYNYIIFIHINKIKKSQRSYLVYNILRTVLIDQQNLLLNKKMGRRNVCTYAHKFRTTSPNWIVGRLNSFFFCQLLLEKGLDFRQNLLQKKGYNIQIHKKYWRFKVRSIQFEKMYISTCILNLHDYDDVQIRTS